MQNVKRSAKIAKSSNDRKQQEPTGSHNRYKTQGSIGAEEVGKSFLKNMLTNKSRHANITKLSRRQRAEIKSFCKIKKDVDKNRQDVLI